LPKHLPNSKLLRRVCKSIQIWRNGPTRASRLINLRIHRQACTFALFVTNLLPTVGFSRCFLQKLIYSTEYSRHRHVRYCNTRARSRPRSCRACNVAKTKCTFETPCSRCIKKSIECSYGETTAITKRISGASPSSNVASFDSDLQSTLQLDSNRVTELRSSTQLNTLLELDPPAFLGYNSFVIDEFTLFDDDTFNQVQRVSDATMVPCVRYDHETPSWCSWTSGGFPLSIVKENSMLELDRNLVAVVQTERPLAQSSANLVIQALRSFPTMMLRKETFPWFIHSQSRLFFKPAEDDLPEALSNCMSISQMFALRTPETKRYLWGNIRGECHRFINEVLVLL
jgi:Fungal Zn(2)-Cys(6) binuclear cluster domain